MLEYDVLESVILRWAEYAGARLFGCRDVLTFQDFT